MGLVARQLWESAGIGPEDVQTAVIYDHFTPFVLTQLEEFGFCKRGEARDFVRAGEIELGGRLPININRVPDVEHVLVTAGTGVPTSGLLLSVA